MASQLTTFQVETSYVAILTQAAYRLPIDLRISNLY